LRRPRGADELAQLTRPPRLTVPAAVPTRLLPAPAVRAFNAAHWHATARTQRARPAAITSYLFPLDVLGAWNRLYGPAGLVQYQFVVPVGAEAELVRGIRILGERRLPVFLAVCKRLGPQTPAPLSFPLEGWTLAVDLPADAPGLGEALAELDEIVAACGGRVYLTKDALLPGHLAGVMYPGLSELRHQCERVDPHGVLGSDLSRRLGLREDPR
jgi:decaprenylphospho-beta-D-ribofuranose 2-oxidase